MRVRLYVSGTSSIDRTGAADLAADRASPRVIYEQVTLVCFLARLFSRREEDLRCAPVTRGVWPNDPGEGIRVTDVWTAPRLYLYGSTVPL